VGAYEALATVVATIILAFIGAWGRSRAAEKRQKDAERTPALEAARDAEAFKARDLARGDDGIRVRAKDGSPRILGTLPGPADDADRDGVPD